MLDVDCEKCGARFTVPRSMRGGLANCPKCQKAVPVKGGWENLYRFIILFTVLGGAGATLAAWHYGGPGPALTVGIIVCIILAGLLFGM